MGGVLGWLRVGPQVPVDGAWPGAGRKEGGGARVLCVPLLSPAPESCQRPPCLLWVSHDPAAAGLGLRRGRQRARVPSDPSSWGLTVVGALAGRPKAGAWEQDSPAAAEVELRPPPALGLVCVRWRPRSRPHTPCGRRPPCPFTRLPLGLCRSVWPVGRHVSGRDFLGLCPLLR